MLRLILKHFGPEHYAPFALEMAVLIKQVGGGSTECRVIRSRGRTAVSGGVAGSDGYDGVFSCLRRVLLMCALSRSFSCCGSQIERGYTTLYQ